MVWTFPSIRLSLLLIASHCFSLPLIASQRGTLRPARAKPYPFPSHRPTMPQSASGDRQQREALFASRDGELFVPHKHDPGCSTRRCFETAKFYCSSRWFIAVRHSTRHRPSPRRRRPRPGRALHARPGANIYRSPLNRRNLESFGEDPFLSVARRSPARRPHRRSHYGGLS